MNDAVVSSPASRPKLGPNVGWASRMHRLWRWVVRFAATAAAVTAAIGILHMPFAAPLLRKISFASMCPVTRGSPEQIDRAHALGAAAIRKSATTQAPARPALGFELDKTTKSEVSRWAAAHRVECRAISGNENLQRCLDIPSSVVGAPHDAGPLEEATFEFDKAGVLVDVQTLRRHLAPSEAAELVSRLEERARTELGEPATLAGAPTAAHLSHGLLATFVAVHTFTDYRASITATNLAPTGTMVREEYLSLH